MNSNSKYRDDILSGYMKIIDRRQDTYLGLDKWVQPSDIVHVLEGAVCYRTVLYHCQSLTIKGVFQMKNVSDKYQFFCLSKIPDGYEKGKRRNNWNRIKGGANVT